ncbi:MAG TPA: DUF302 domain-containing protein [Candidatus Tumulicola sp.]
MPTDPTATTRTSRFSYSETIATLSQAIVSTGNALFATIDQAAAAAKVGLQLRPTTLIVFGNPKGGTPLMDAFPLTALELPLKLLVWEAEGTVNVSYVPAAGLAARYGVTGMESILQNMDRALDALTGAVT